MVIRSIRVRNLLSISDETVSCQPLTALVGANGSGKSSFLRALGLFYDPAAKYTEDDFHARNIAEPISITITYTDLTADEMSELGSRTENGDLTVEKVLSHPPGRGSQRYYGTRLAHPGFQHVRDAPGANDQRRLYGELRQTAEYGDLPACRSAREAEDALAAWEQNHQDQLTRLRDSGQFFGFREVGEAHLERHTSFVLVPAVRDAADEAGDGKGSALSQLMDMVVTATLAQRGDLVHLKQTVQEQYDEITNPENTPELVQLQTDLGSTLTSFAPNAGVVLSWQKQNVEIPMPQALPLLVEDGFAAPVGRTGHGLQRAFILTLFQHLAVARPPAADANGDADTTEAEPPGGDLPGLILAVEEPELYQHPSRQRLMADVLRRLSRGEIPGVASRTQVLYSTHSPLFVGLDRFDQIRILRKEPIAAGRPLQTRVSSSTLDEVAHKLNGTAPEGARTVSGPEIRAALRALMTPAANEAFFARAVCLVEGVDDHALLSAYAAASGISFDALGICVVCCHSKDELPKAIALFQSLEMPLYVVFDGDRGNPAMPERNRRLLRLLGETETDYPNTVGPRYTAFDTTMRACVLAETQGRFANEVDLWRRESGFIRRDAWRTPVCLGISFRACLTAGVACASLEQVCAHVVGLAN